MGDVALGAGSENTKIVFRALVRVSMDLRPVEQALSEAGWDEIRRGGLLRLVRGWFLKWSPSFGATMSAMTRQPK